MKADSQLREDVIAELTYDPSIHESAIRVAVEHGAVTVAGHVATFAEKSAVEQAVRRVDGVRAILLRLDVIPSAQHKRTDAELAAAVADTLRWNSQVPPGKVQATVDRGCVCLRGEVEWEFQRRAAHEAIRSLVGVVDIRSEITLKRKPTQADVANRIEEALVRQAVREARRVQVEVTGGVVTLRGRVHSWQEREAAAGAAWAVPGVVQVVDDLHIGV